MSNWKEEFEEHFPIPDHDRMSKCGCRSEAEHVASFAWVPSREEVEDHIETEIIEKLIEEIPATAVTDEKWEDGRWVQHRNYFSVQEQLRAKWLGNKN